MAIIDKNHNKWFIDDKDENVFIGLKIPMALDNGSEASTKTTLEAVKQNVLNLCSTERGERVMQPNLGLRLRHYLFEPFSHDLILEVKNTIAEALKYWLPFILINDINVRMSDNQTGDFINVMDVKVNFSLKKDPTSHESVQITIGE